MLRKEVEADEVSVKKTIVMIDSLRKRERKKSTLV